MSVNSLFAASNSDATAASSTSASSASTNNNLINENTFMNLLVKELQNQDPTSPMSNSDFISELAQFNSMNQLSSMNTSMQNLASTIDQSSMGSAVNLIGRMITATGGSFNYSGSGTSTLDYSLPQNASSVTMDIYDNSGNLVYNTNLGNISSGSQTFNWDGLTNSGSTAPSGSYTFSVNGTDSSGNSVQGTTYSNATVTGLTNSSSGGIELELNTGQTVPLSSVTGVN